MRAEGVGMTSQRARDRLVPLLQSLGIRDMMVLMAIRQTPRHLFVEEALAGRAYENIALPIGYGQTISQPYTVARMTELVMEHRPRRVLEVGTGSGYQAAVLAQLEVEVYTVERIAKLHQRSRRLLAELGLDRVHCHLAGNEPGWPEQAPFDAILMTAAAESAPSGLLEQLAPGGALVLPLGSPGERQVLTRIVRRDEGFEQESIEDVHFVPFVQGEAE